MEQIACILVGFVCMGAGCGFERSLLPRMAVTVFHETSSVTRMSFVATFGLFKAVANAIAGPLADRWGRKPLLVAGCLVGLPVMPYVTVAATWNGVTYINAAFGLSQGFLGSSLFFLLIDVMGPTKRGVAVGIGESTIYISMAATNLLAGYLAEEYGFRPVPFYCATFFTVVGLLAAIPLKDTLDQVRMEQHEIVISSGDRKKIRKYARMMSTQPSHMDEESIIARIDDNGETLTLDGSFLPSFASPYQSIRTIPVYESEQNGLINPPNNVYLGESGYASTRTSGYNTPRRGFLSGYQSPADTSPNNAQFAEVKGESTATLTADLLKKRQTISFSPEWEKGHYGYLVDAPTIISVMDALEQPAESSLKTLRKLLFHNSSFATLCLSGMILNFKEGFAWGSFPVFFKRHDLSEENITLLVALYPLAWGLSQGGTGYLSDRFGRKIFIILGTMSCVAAMVLFTVPGTLWGVVGDVRHFRTWVAADLFLGIGTALVYPALQAGAADEVEPMHRGLALGTYRFIRDIGYVVGAVVCGHLTDDIGYEGTFLVNAAVLGAALLCVIIFYHPNEPEELIEVVLPDEESRLITKKSLIGSPRGSTGREDGKIYAIPKTVRILVPQYSDSF